MLLAMAALGSLAVTQIGALQRSDGDLNLLELSFFFGAGGFVPLFLCILYVCSVEARLSRAERLDGASLA